MDHEISGRGPAGENEPGLCTPIAVLAIGLSPERADSQASASPSACENSDYSPLFVTASAEVLRSPAAYPAGCRS